MILETSSPSSEAKQVQILSADEANRQADILIASLNPTVQAKAESRVAVNILGVAVGGQNGVTATAIICKLTLLGITFYSIFTCQYLFKIFTNICYYFFLAVTRLSDYVEKAGCTPQVQAAIRNLLQEEYNGATTAFTSALRSLDVWNTPVGALGACLEESTSPPAVSKSDLKGR